MLFRSRLTVRPYHELEIQRREVRSRPSALPGQQNVIDERRAFRVVQSAAVRHREEQIADEHSVGRLWRGGEDVVFEDLGWWLCTKVCDGGFEQGNDAWDRLGSE